MVLIDHADEHLLALCRRGQRHDDHLVMADLSGAEIRLVRDRMAEPDEFVLHPPVPPRQILRRHAEAGSSNRALHDPVHGSTETSNETAGGAGGARTHDRRIMRSTARCIVCATCTDTTESRLRWR